MSDWLAAEEFGELAGISSRKARHTLSSVKDGCQWRQHTLEVRTVSGRGGKSGVQYQVKVSSLPIEIQERLNALQTVDEDASNLRTGEQAQTQRNWKYDTIRAALAHPKHSAGRKAEVDRLVGTAPRDWKGKKRKLTKTVLYGWIKAFEDEGIHALAQKIRRDKGVRRVFISRTWSAAVPFDDDTKAAIERDLKRYVRGLISNGSQYKQTRFLVSSKLAEISALHGFIPNDESQNQAVFHIPPKFIQAEKQYKAVYKRRSDRKGYEDDKPRIQRSIVGMVPMEGVVADIHHVNVRLLREDGSVATPKMVTFFDLATERFYFEFILFERGGGVRNTDVIQTFAQMCMDPAFGLPRTLYFDNGSEYRWADHMEDALKLGVRFREIDREERNQVIRATPYNAAAKRIEAGFRELNQQVFRHVPGWIDDDRMKPKGNELGKAHLPYQNGFEAFCREVRQLMLAYDNMPKSGALKGRSPAQAFGEFVHEGWQATALDPHDLLTVFTKVEPRSVRKHCISVDNRQWSCDALRTYFGNKVFVHIPVFGIGFNALMILDENGIELGIAEPLEQFAYFDPRGAKESSRQNSIRNRALTKLAKSAAKVDVRRELIAYGEKHASIAPNEPNGVISVSRSHRNGLAVIPPMTAKKTQDQIEEEQRAEDEARALFLKAVTAGKGL